MAASDKNRGDDRQAGDGQDGGNEPLETGAFSASADNDHDGDGAGDDPLETERLALDDDNERLPWLESDDDDDNAAEAGGSRILGLALLGLVALAVIVGGIWWSTNRTPDAALVADGSVIRAPTGDYKEAPKDPGGKTFDGTGNTAFAVSEGQSRPAKLGEATPPSPGPVAKPGFELAKPSSAAPSPGPATAAAKVAASGGPVVQVGAYSSRASAEAAWGRLAQQYSALSGVRHQVVEGTADIGTVFRLQALAGDAGAAQGLCSRLKSAGLACQVK